MDVPRTVPADSFDIDEFHVSGTQAYPAENLKTCNCGGIDTPGCGVEHAPGCPLSRVTPPSLRRLLDGEPPRLLLVQERENADDVELLAGIERSMKVLNDRRQSREDLLSSLLFAARSLAEHNLYPSHGRGFNTAPARCLECAAIEHLGYLQHTKTCRTGRVLGIIAELVATANFNHKEKENAPVEETSPQRLRPVAGDPEEHRADDGIRPRGEFGEPWSLVSFDLHHQRACIATGNGIARQFYDFCGAFPNLIAATRRIIACVNYCAGIPTEKLADGGKPVSE